MPCCNQSICEPTTQTPEERCEELQPHFNVTVECDKIYVEWDGAGNPDTIQYQLYKWVPAIPSGWQKEIIATSAGSRNTIFHCVPEGDYAILVTASVCKLMPVYDGCGCGSTTYHYEMICVKQWDNCNCLITCPEGEQCISGDCVGPVEATYFCSIDCDPQEFGVTPNTSPDYTFPIYDYEQFVSGDSEGRKFWESYSSFPTFVERCASLQTMHPYESLNLLNGVVSNVVYPESQLNGVNVSYQLYPLPGETQEQTEQRVRDYIKDNLCPDAIIGLSCYYNSVAVKNIQDCTLRVSDVSEDKSIQIGGCYGPNVSKQNAVDGAFVALNAGIWDFFQKPYNGITYRNRIRCCHNYDNTNPNECFRNNLGGSSDPEFGVSERWLPFLYGWKGRHLGLPYLDNLTSNGNPVKGIAFNKTTTDNYSVLYNSVFSTAEGVSDGWYSSKRFTVNNPSVGVDYITYQTLWLTFRGLCLRHGLRYKLKVKWSDSARASVSYLLHNDTAVTCFSPLPILGYTQYDPILDTYMDNTSNLLQFPAGSGYIPGEGEEVFYFKVGDNSNQLVDALSVVLIRQCTQKNTADPGPTPVSDSRSFMNVYSITLEVDCTTNLNQLPSPSLVTTASLEPVRDVPETLYGSFVNLSETGELTENYEIIGDVSNNCADGYFDWDDIPAPICNDYPPTCIT